MLWFRHPIVAVAAIAIAACVPGCGFMLQGLHQRVLVETTPPGAEVSVGGSHAVSPGDILVRRQEWSVFRAQKSGYHEACALIGAPRNPGIVLLNIFLTACTGWIIDRPTQADRHLPTKVHVPLVEAAPEDRSVPLPPDSEILRQWEGTHTDLCKQNRALIDTMRARAQQRPRTEIQVAAQDPEVIDLETQLGRLLARAPEHAPYSAPGRLNATIDEAAHALEDVRGGFDYDTWYTWWKATARAWISHADVGTGADCQRLMPLAIDAEIEMRHVDPPSARGAEHARLKNILGTITGTFRECRPPRFASAPRQEAPVVATPRERQAARTRQPPASPGSSSELPARWQGTVAARVKKAGSEVAVRQAPSPFAAEVERLQPGTPLLARERKGDWVGVTTGDGRRGFVPARALEVP